MSASGNAENAANARERREVRTPSQRHALLRPFLAFTAFSPASGVPVCSRRFRAFSAFSAFSLTLALPLIPSYTLSSVRERRRSKIIPASLLLEAYCKGIFPMAMENGDIAWFSPDPRGIIPLDAFHIPHGLKRTLKKAKFQIRLNTAFEEVIRSCGERAETWISEEIIESYINLHRLGFAHSVEAWQENELAGGLYGVSVYGAFFGESMFHKVADASKVTLVGLVNRLNERGFRLLDTQYVTGHLTMFGAVEISRPNYLRLLNQALALDCKFC